METRRRMIVVIAFLVTATAFFGAGFKTARLLQGRETVETILTRPLPIASDNAESTLPVGTTLVYEDERIKKSGTLYRVYVRVEGLPLETTRVRNNWFVSPLRALNSEE